MSEFDCGWIEDEICDNCIHAKETEIDCLYDCDIDHHSKDYDMWCESWKSRYEDS